MATPGYDGQVIGRDCDCEDFPCCGHGITQADVQSYDDYMWERYEQGLYERDEELEESEEEL